MPKRVPVAQGRKRKCAWSNGRTPYRDWIERLGDQCHVPISVRDQKLVTLEDLAVQFRPGDEIRLSLNNALYFDEDGRRIRK